MTRALVGVVLAAGLGTRLRPATLKCPKPLIPVAGIEPLFFAVWKLYQLGVRKIFINAHYLPEQIEAAVKRWSLLFPAIEMTVVSEAGEILGTGGALLNLFTKYADAFKERGLILLNGDTLAQINLEQLIKDADTSCFAVSKRSDHLTKYNKLWINDQDEFRGVGSTFENSAKDHNDMGVHFLGVHFLSVADVQRLIEAQMSVRSVDLFTGVYSVLLSCGRAPKAIEFFWTTKTDTAHEFWFDMTNEDFLIEAQKHLLGELSPDVLWRRVLYDRHPGIQELAPGCFVLTESIGDWELHGPLVLVSESGTIHGVLGPSLSLLSYAEKAFKTRSPLAHKSILFLADAAPNQDDLEKNRVVVQ